MSDLVPFAIAGLGWLVLTGLGFALLSLVPNPARRRLLPACPLLGLCLLVSVLSFTTLFTSARRGMLVVVVVAVLLAALGTQRSGREAWSYRRADIAFALAVAVLSLAPLSLALAPSSHVGGGILQGTANHDAAFYIGLTDWLEDHDGVHEPRITPDAEAPHAGPPAAGPARTAIVSHLRIGESLAQAGLNVSLGTDATTSFTPFTALWAALVVASVAATGRLLRLHWIGNLIAALAVGVLPLTIRQVYNQNAASLLGIALAPIVLAMFADVVSQRRRIPLWLAGLGLGALVGVYIEYLSIVVPAAILLTLLRRPSDWLRAVTAAATTVAVSVALVPLAWWNAAKSASLTAGVASNGMLSNYRNNGTAQNLARMVGEAPQVTPPVPPNKVLLALVLLAVAAGLVLGLQRRVRAYALGAGGASLLVIAYYTLFEQERQYTHGRVVELGMPLVVAAAALGWAAAAHPARSSPPAARVMTGRGICLGLAVLSAAIWGISTARTSLDQGRSSFYFADLQKVDPTYEQAAAWVDELGGANGRDVTVVVPDFLNQLWLVLRLHDEAAVSYPVLRPDYTGSLSSWQGEADPYLLVDSAALVSAEPATVVRQNARFTLLDLRRGSAVVAVLAERARATPGVVVPLADDQLLVLRSPQDAREPVSVGIEGATTLDGWQVSGDGVRSSVPTSTPDGPRLVVDVPGQVIRLRLVPPAGIPDTALPNVVDTGP